MRVRKRDITRLASARSCPGRAVRQEPARHPRPGALPPMKQILLATALVALPVAVFSAVEHYIAAPPAASASATAEAATLGDPVPFRQIVTDTRALADDRRSCQGRGDPHHRFRDRLGRGRAGLRPMDSGRLGQCRRRRRRGLRRAPRPTARPRKGRDDPGRPAATLADPSATSRRAEPSQPRRRDRRDRRQRSPAALRDHAHRPADALSDGSIASAERQRPRDLQSKALERCNADDDTRADAFTAQALALA